MKTLVIDNYDSFTYNLVHILANVASTTPIISPSSVQAVSTLSYMGDASGPNAAVIQYRCKDKSLSDGYLKPSIG